MTAYLKKKPMMLYKCDGTWQLSETWLPRYMSEGWGGGHLTLETRKGFSSLYSSCVIVASSLFGTNFCPVTRKYNSYFTQYTANAILHNTLLCNKHNWCNTNYTQHTSECNTLHTQNMADVTLTTHNTQLMWNYTKYCWCNTYYMQHTADVADTTDVTLTAHTTHC